MSSYLYIPPRLESTSVFEASDLATMTERHHFKLPLMSFRVVLSLEEEIKGTKADGIVFGIEQGLPSRRQLRLLGEALRTKKPVYLFWPMESAVEVVDAERLASFWRHWIVYIGIHRLLGFKQKATTARYQLRHGVGRLGSAKRRFKNGLRILLSPTAPQDLRPALANLAQELGGFASGLSTARFRFKSIASALRAVENQVGEIEGVLAQLKNDLARGTAGETIQKNLVTAMQALPGIQKGLTGVHGQVELAEAAVGRVGDILETRARELEQSYASSSANASAETRAILARYRDDLIAFSHDIAPVAFDGLVNPPRSGAKLPGTGVYIRTDYWAQLVSGGSYGHTCYVADELAKITQDFVCLMARPYALLDDLGLKQEMICPDIVTMNEIDLLRADRFYYDALKKRLQELRPAYIYERAVLGNFAAARLSRELGIPYILEYNGSEISMARSFGGNAHEHEALFLEAERLAFEQATVINVISDHVRNDVVSRGIDPAKVLVNPNGVNTDEYAPASAAERQEIRASLGFSDEDQVIGFIGTFGGWHGIDVLAAAMPQICKDAPNARFLLIGEGNLKPTVLEAIRAHNLQDKVVDVGRTEQRVGARLLKASDIFISPHSSHMKDSPFFGSPTKLFEYMALGGGIVASDLEQIGEVLSPAFRPADFKGASLRVGRERAVLCQPGDVQDFVDGVLALVRNPPVAQALGRNARAAAQETFSWTSHVGRVWQHVLGLRQAQSWRKAS